MSAEAGAGLNTLTLLGTAGLPYAVTEMSFYRRLPTHGPDLVPTVMPFRLFCNALVFVMSLGFGFHQILDYTLTS